jgi:MFS family permease
MNTDSFSLDTIPASGPRASMLVPFIGVVFVQYMVIGMAMPVLPLFVHNDLGFNTVIVGIVVGSQFAVAVVTRMAAGMFVDSRGVKRAVILGLLTTAASGLVNVAAAMFADQPSVSAGLLILGRCFLGAGENLLITGSLCWGMVMVGQQHAGQAMAWIGTAIFAGMAVSAPLGNALYGSAGFLGVALLSTVLPLLGVRIVSGLRPVVPPRHARPSFGKVAKVVFGPGFGVALSGLGYGAIVTFITLLFVERGWGGVGLVLSAFGASFIVGRLGFGHLPDRIGGARVALVCILIEAVGQGIIWLAPGMGLAVVGVTLSGLGYSLVYPALGVEALARVSSEHRGLAMGSYTVFLDISLGSSGPLLGWVAGRAGLGSVYLVGMAAALCATVVIVAMLRRSGASGSRA